MNIISFTISATQIGSFSAFCKKVKRNVPDFKADFGQVYDRLFKHDIIDADGYHGTERMWHAVCDVTATMPEDNGWCLMATYEDGLVFPANPTRELVVKNPAHGLDYDRCDVCGHWCKKSYLVLNVKTGEELQVGCECAKKFGLKQLNWISKFTRELKRVICCWANVGEDESPELTWRGAADKEAYAATEKNSLICAARVYYSAHPKWIRGYYEGGAYYPSASQKEIRSILANRAYEDDAEYCAKVCEWAMANIEASDSDFKENMFRVAKDFYAQRNDAVFAYFMVKGYEEWTRAQSKDAIRIERGMQVKVTGEIIAINSLSGAYGTYNEYTIKTPKGFVVTRAGTVPVSRGDGDVLRTSFFAPVISCRGVDVKVGRALKNAKKGVETIEL